MEEYIKIIVYMFAGIGAGIGTGFAGLSAAAFIAPMLVAFLDFPSYDAIGIALISDVLASAVSATAYAVDKNIDVKKGSKMLVVVLCFTVLGSFLASKIDNHLMGNFSIFATSLLGLKFILVPVNGRDPLKDRLLQKQMVRRGANVRAVGNDWYDLRIRRCGRWHDDAPCAHVVYGISA